MTFSRLLLALCVTGGRAWGQVKLVFFTPGPDAAAYGLERNYPYGPPAGGLVQIFMVGTFSHFHRIFPLSMSWAKGPSHCFRETYRYDGITLSLAEHLQLNATTRLLIARGGTIPYEHYQSPDGK
jgi:hypothetical protein